MKLTKVCIICRGEGSHNKCCPTHSVMVHTKDIRRDSDGTIIDVQPATKEEIAIYHGKA